MDDTRKKAYRWLLYDAMLEIRPISWRPLPRWTFLNQSQWRNTSFCVHKAGALADWLHNLAMFSARDFEGFDEARFWKELADINEQYPEFELTKYHRTFERILAR